jgi:hypothetical protein
MIGNSQRDISKYLFVAGILFTLEIVLGIGVIGVVAGISSAAAYALAERRGTRFSRRISTSGVFFLLALATFGWLTLNVEIRKANAVPVIQACEAYRFAHQRYPSTLRDLVPELLPSIPRARYTVVENRFSYGSEPAELCFPAMFHGVFCYHFVKGMWITNE